MHGFVHRALAPGAAAILFAAGLSACSPAVDKTAAADIVVFLNAARTGDRVTFEAHIDRETVRDDVRAQVAALPGVKEMQNQLGEGMAQEALDRMVSPDAVLRLEKPKDGSAAASLDEVRPRLKSISGGRVCLRDPDVKDRCLLTFGKVGGVWKLVGAYAERQSFDPPGVPAPVMAAAPESED